ncbi:cell cycle checkpoint control protein RAD9A [Lutzomyia longipalpis]|uniref:cell cycle checkpoint control protein RAD9A n=1 Tax=Lutzomyia longipalpis TaxID=7200 RepID=UPI002484385E|nr:cell cycle checkpoint control protein RAD9A [Lutzomyia longipalpis]
MKCSMHGSNARVLHKVIQNLAKIGSDLYLEAMASGLSLRAANSIHSSFMKVHFSQSFFIEYHQQIVPSSESNETKCRVSLKSLLSVFRNIKQVEVCILRLDHDKDMLTIRLRCAEEKVRMMYVPILEQETLDAVMQRDMPSSLVCSASLFTNITNSLQAEAEITMDVSNDKIILKNYIDDRIVDKTVVRTRFTLHPEEFQEYSIAQETRLTFCLRSFRAILALGEALGASSNIKLDFDSEGDPMLCTVNEDPIEGCLLLSTLAREMYENSMATTYDEAVHSEILPNDSSMRKSQNKRQKSPSLEKQFKSPVPPKRPRPEKPCPELMTKSQIENADTLVDSQQNSLCGGSQNVNRSVAVINSPPNQQPCSSRNANKSPSLIILDGDNHPQPENLQHITKDTRDDAQSSGSSVNIIFQRESESTENSYRRTVDIDDPDVVPASPPREEDLQRMRTRKIFRRCFEPTFHFSRRIEKNQILAENSDSD